MFIHGNWGGVFVFFVIVNKLSYNVNMQRLRLIRILDLLIEAGWLAVVFFIPLYFAVFFKTNDVFELNKIILFKILALLLLFFSLCKFIANFKKEDTRYLKERAANYSTYLLIPLLFLLSFSLAALFSKNISLSYYGIYERYQGLESHIYYLLFFILLLFNLKNREQINRIIITAALSSFFVCLYGLMQIAGLDFIDWSEPTYLTKRITSSFGQPNFLASYLLLIMPLAGYLFFKSKKFLVKFYWLLVLFFQLLCLLFTYSRAGWLGLIAGLFIAGFIYFFAKKDAAAFSPLFKKYKKIIIYSVGACFCLLVFIGAGLLSANSNSFFAVRVKSIFNTDAGSNAARINFWKASLDAVKKKPIFGYGPDNQGEVFVKYYDKDWAVSGQVNVYPSRAHNLLLDTLLTTGAVGLIFYLALLYLFYKVSIDNIRNNKSALLSWLILSAMIGYLISLFFGFAIVATNVYFWLYFAVIIVINRNYRQKRESSETPPCHSCESGNPGVNRKNLVISFIKIILLFLTGTAVFYQANYEIKHLIADHYFRELKQAVANQEYYKAYELYGYIKEENIKDNDYGKYFANALSDWLGGFDALVFIKPGEKILENILTEMDANLYSNIFAKAKIYTALASEEGPDYYDLAESDFKKAIELSPRMPKNYRELAKLYFKKGEYEKAAQNYEKALANLPDINNLNIPGKHRNLINYEKYLTYKGLGDLYFKQKLHKEAEDYYWLAYRNNTADIALFKKAADTYYLRGDLDKAIWCNKRGMALSPKDYVWPYSIALLYQEKGDKDNALKFANIALGASPENNKLKTLIKLIKD